jgi:hypothetical protein
MKNESILSQLIVAAIYITLGIPLIVTSMKSPAVLDPNNANSGDFFKSDNAVCLSGKMIQFLADQKPGDQISESALKSGMKADGDLATSFNATRTCSLVVGIILLCFAFLNIVSALVPKKKKK